MALRMLTEKACLPEELEIKGIYGVSFFRGTLSKVVQLQKSVLTGFGNPCDVPFRSSGITRSPHKEKK
jgi:hypothetical protein